MSKCGYRLGKAFLFHNVPTPISQINTNFIITGLVGIRVIRGKIFPVKVSPKIYLTPKILK